MPRAAQLGWLLLLGSVALSAETLATEAEALKIVFPRAQKIDSELRTLTPEQRDTLQKKSGLRFPEREYKWFTASKDGSVTGRALALNEIGKHEYITFMTALTPAGKVSDVVVMEYRESRGGEVREQRFLRQFRGKKSSDPIQVNRDIVNYTGATLSSHAIARGVKKALLLHELFFAPAGSAKSGSAKSDGTK